MWVDYKQSTNIRHISGRRVETAPRRNRLARTAWPSCIVGGSSRPRCRCQIRAWPAKGRWQRAIRRRTKRQQEVRRPLMKATVGKPLQPLAGARRRECPRNARSSVQTKHPTKATRKMSRTAGTPTANKPERRTQWAHTQCLHAPALHIAQLARVIAQGAAYARRERGARYQRRSQIATTRTGLRQRKATFAPDADEPTSNSNR